MIIRDVAVQQYVINERWMFSVIAGTLFDLEANVPVAMLRPVTARILTLLLQESRTVWHRKKLFDEGWRAFGFEVCENSLNQVVCVLRKTFDQLDPGQQYIKTVPRIGYCFLANARIATAAECQSVGVDKAFCRGETPGLETGPEGNDGHNGEIFCHRECTRNSQTRCTLAYPYRNLHTVS